MGGVSKSQVSRLCEEIDERVNAFLDRSVEGDWPYLWIDATYVKVRQNGRIVLVAAIIAVGVNNDGRRGIRCPGRRGERTVQRPWSWRQAGGLPAPRRWGLATRCHRPFPKRVPEHRKHAP